MQSNFYVGLSGQNRHREASAIRGQQHRQPEHGRVPGDGVNFSTILSNAGDRPVAFSSEGADYISRREGELTKTDNTLDVAVRGEGFMAVKTPSGIVYTRDGRMKMAPTGELMSLNGYPVPRRRGHGPSCSTPTAVRPRSRRTA